MVGPTFGGDPDDTGVAPVPLTLLGAIVIALSLGLGGGLALVGGVMGAGLGTAGIWLLVGGLLLGVALIGWDKMTDYFAAAPPPGREPVPDEDDDAIGEPVDDLGPD